MLMQSTEMAVNNTAWLTGFAKIMGLECAQQIQKEQLGKEMDMLC